MAQMRSGMGLLMIFLTVLMTVVQCLGIESWLWLRSGITAGEWWRLYTGHFVHLGWIHLIMNAIALWLLAGLFGGILRAGDWMLALLVIPLVISGGFWWGLPELSAYAGLSGVLHGIFAMGSLRMLGSATDRTAGLGYVILLLAKLFAERFTGETTVTAGWIGGPVLIEAHQYGAAAGVMLAVLQGGWMSVRTGLSRVTATKLVP